MIVKLRKWELADAEDLAKALSNKKVQDRLRDGLPYPYTEQDGREYISAMLAADANDTFAFAVTVDEKVIGSIGAFRQANIHNRTAELGYYIAEEYWGKGITTEAVKQLCDYVKYRFYLIFAKFEKIIMLLLQKTAKFFVLVLTTAKKLLQYVCKLLYTNKNNASMESVSDEEKAKT